MPETAPQARPLRLVMQGAILVASISFLASCSSTDTQAEEPNIEPLAADSDDTEPSQGPDIEYFYADDVETEGTFVLDEDGIETTLTMNAVGGIVTEQTTTNVFDYASFGINSPEQAKEALAQVAITVDDVNGFEQEMDYGETQATQVTTINFEELDFSEVENVPVAITSGVTEDSVVSYESNRQMLLDVGFVEVQ